MSERKNKTEFENWHKPIYTEDPDHVPVKFSKPPVKYEAGFLAKLDKRTEVYQLLNDAYQEVVGDIGGVENLSHVQVCLAERFCFLEFVLRGIEHRIATEPNKSGKLLSRWVQALNSLVGLGRTIGLERRVKKIANLRTYIEDKK
jgi:hypothetical protein